MTIHQGPVWQIFYIPHVLRYGVFSSSVCFFYFGLCFQRLFKNPLMFQTCPILRQISSWTDTILVMKSINTMTYWAWILLWVLYTLSSASCCPQMHIWRTYSLSSHNVHLDTEYVLKRFQGKKFISEDKFVLSVIYEYQEFKSKFKGWIYFC